MKTPGSKLYGLLRHRDAKVLWIIEASRCEGTQGILQRSTAIGHTKALRDNRKQTQGLVIIVYERGNRYL